MLKAVKIDTERAPMPWAAIRDASMRNAVGMTHFTAAEKRKSESMLFALQLCYRCDNSYINWRDGGSAGRPKFAAIKIENPTISDRKALNLLEEGWKTDAMLKKITKRITPQGILYRAYF